MERTNHKRDLLYKKFEKLYNIRSDIMHGKQRKWQRADGNLKKLSELSSLLRNLWHKILTDKNLQTTLEADDNIRKAFFKRIQSAYSAPTKRPASETMSQTKKSLHYRQLKYYG
jgi:hypothetical protein